MADENASPADKPPSRFARLFTRFVLLPCAALFVWGVVNYNLTSAVHPQFWSDIAARLHGPMTFRFYLQPTMALIAALPAGMADARRGRHAFFFEAWFHPGEHTGRLREGLIAAARIVLLGLGMDLIYQIKVFDRFFPVEALVMALMLALVPYFVFREIVERVARWRLTRRAELRGRPMDEPSAAAV